ncbi:MAG: gliding motility-associated C-terminal domain-containing protein [Bacteroidia bacterium]
MWWKNINRLLVLLLCVFNEVFAQQNLIKNHSFEEHTGDCGASIFFDNIVPYWYSPGGGTPDYFNQCYMPGGLGIPSNGFGFQYANEGNAYVGIRLGQTPPAPATQGFYEYISQNFGSTLKAGKKYCVFFYASLADLAHLSAINRIGMVISSNGLVQNNIDPIVIKPQIYYDTLSLLSDTLNWVKIEGEFVANGNEQYVTIGNFYPVSQTTYADSVIRAPYYYIDNVWLYECEEDTVPLEPPPASDSSLHYKLPNVISPNADGLNDAFVLESRGVREVGITLYNRWGEEVHRHKVSGISTDVLTKTILWDATHNNKPAPQGVYYYIIELSTKTGEVIIEKGTVMVL